jgi:hypothetical protein
MTNTHIDLRRIIVEDWLTIPGQEKFKQRAMDILDKWEQVLLNDLQVNDYFWARVASPSSPRPYNHHSLVYVPRHKRQGERHFPAYRDWEMLYLIRHFQIALRKVL